MLSSRTDLLKKAASNINQYSPLIIQGEAGVGKSFFLESLCRELCHDGTIKEYTIRNSWDIINDMISALCEKNMDAWRREWLSAEILVIEDLHFLKGKSATLEELYQIFRSVTVPIIITTSLPITRDNIPCEDLVAFLNEGTQILLTAPSKEDIDEYFCNMLQSSGIRLTDEANDWLRKQSIHSLAIAKGIVKTVQFYKENKDAMIGVDDCISILQPFLDQTKKERL